MISPEFSVLSAMIAITATRFAMIFSFIIPIWQDPHSNGAWTLLFEYEDKLGLLKQFQFMKESLEGVNKRLRNCTSEEEKQNICDEIDKLIIRWEE